ncbi:MAG: glycosyltransferase family 4 protein [Rubrobacteraceae bacterium]
MENASIRLQRFRRLTKVCGGLRVAIFTETFLPATDGVVTRLRNTVEELGRLGDDVIVFAPALGGPDSYAGAEIYRVPGVRLLPYPQIRLAPPHPGVARALKRFQPDVVHAVNPVALGVGGVFLARTYKIPLVCSYHTNVAAYANYYRLGFMVNFTRNVTRFVHNRAQVNLCTSKTTMEYLLREGIKQVRLWPQGVDARRFGPDHASPEWRERLTGGYPEERLMIYVGRLAPEKHIKNLKAVFNIPGCRLAIIGDGPARNELEGEFSGTPTVFTGVLKGEDLAGAYASGDIFLFPSTTETLGMAMIEALASAVPVVAARSGASHEVVDEGETGFLYETREDLLSAVTKLHEDEALRQRMGTNARSVAEERSWENSTRELRSHYEQAQKLL